MSDPAAYHEFAMFGRKRVYLSHYPMFHAVHAYQALIEVRLRKDGHDWADAWFADRQRHPARFYTLSPSKRGSPVTRRRADWPLPSKIRAGARFNADVHWGARVDQFLARDVTVTVARVFHFRQFQEDDRRPRRLGYLVFGAPDDLYLAHAISVPPDFDQIVSVEQAGGALPRARFLRFEVARQDAKTTRLRRKGQVVKGQLVPIAGPGRPTARQYPSTGAGKPAAGARGTACTLRVLRELYYSPLDEES